jgi:hypothetical protein
MQITCPLDQSDTLPSVGRFYLPVYIIIKRKSPNRAKRSAAKTESSTGIKTKLKRFLAGAG